MSGRTTRPTAYAELIDVLNILPLVVREKRRRCGLTLRGAGEQAGVPFNVITRFEQGKGASLANTIALLRWVSQP